MAHDHLGQESHALYSVEYTEHEEYLHAFLFGPDISYDEAITAWRDIADLCKEKGFHKVLIEEDFPTQLSVAEIYSFVSRLHELGFTGIRIAFVDRQLDQLPINVFGENVGVNRGIVGKVCVSIEEAIEYLFSR